MTSPHTASGKVILLGEHAVVYGTPAIAVGIDRGARATARPKAEGGASLLVLGDEGREVIADATAGDDLARAFAALLAAPSTSPPGPVLVEATADLLPGGGLGCSAALGVAIGRAVESLATDAVAEDAVLARAAAWEGIFHGNASGIDALTAARGGCLRFSRKDGARAVALGKDLELCIGSTGAGASTKAMVESVARLFERKPDVRNKSLDGVTALVENAELALVAGDLSAVGKLMDLNQMILAGLFVSTETIEALCGIARDAGALGAKLTGAGGGGSVVALADDAASAHRILAAWQSAGFSGFATRVSSSRREAS